MFVDKISQIIYPQVSQLVNIHVTKYINTGDRMQDGVYILIANTMFNLLVNMLWHIVIRIYTAIRVWSRVINQDNPTCLCVAEIIKSVTPELVAKYMHCVPVSSSAVVAWAKAEHIVDEINSTKQLVYHSQTGGKLIVAEDDPKAATTLGIFIPVFEYKNAGTLEYVFFCNGNLYSQNLQALETIYTRLSAYIAAEPVGVKQPKSGSDTHLVVQCVVPNEKDCNFTFEHRGQVPQRIIFDRIHFDKKELMLEWLDLFVNKAIYPKDLCLPNKLGILLYGPPGTGKTGCISALANYLGRGIIHINSLSIAGKSKNGFVQTINKVKKTHIIVFDEIDYLLSTNSNAEEAAKNAEREARASEQDLQNTLLLASEEERKDIIKTLKQTVEKNKSRDSQACVDERFILQLFDGLGDDDDRIMIGTTNRPDLISAAMTRPGRFDLVVKLGYCSIPMFTNITKTKFPEIITMMQEDENIITRINVLLGLNITPLVLINNLVSSKTVEELFELLEKLDQASYTCKPKISM
jgi:hypothetical protein